MCRAIVSRAECTRKSKNAFILTECARGETIRGGIVSDGLDRGRFGRFREVEHAILYI